MGYQKGEKTFYVSPTNWKGEEEGVISHIGAQGLLWHEKNVCFKAFLQDDQDLSWFFGKMFHFFDVNHVLQAQHPYIDKNHALEEDQHISMDSFILDTTNGLVKLLTLMMDVDK